MNIEQTIKIILLKSLQTQQQLMTGLIFVIKLDIFYLRFCARLLIIIEIWKQNTVLPRLSASGPYRFKLSDRS